MKPRTQNASGLIGRCLLAGALTVVGLVQGCQPLSNVQEQNLYGLTRWGYDYQMQQKRNEAIRESGTEVNVYVGERNDNYQSPKKDYIDAPQEDIAKAVQQRLREIKEGKFKN